MGVETYIFDLDRDIYGDTIEVQLLAFDRPEQKFASLEELKHRIEMDKEFAAGYFERHPEIEVAGRQEEGGRKPLEENRPKETGQRKPIK